MIMENPDTMGKLFNSYLTVFNLLLYFFLG